ncbi:HAD family hydrolase [Marinicrinis lubricantis]|uniref:HAD family hydrolase n=1 Tax=Marinicrinis lubricantis TaxID=2086470 RepID=A0ABW1IK93_9BACL
MIKAVVFDFDGLIVDTETLWFEAYQHILSEKFRCNVTVERFAVCIGTDDHAFFESVENELGTKLDWDPIRKKASEYMKMKLQQPVLREGVAEYLQDAQDFGLRIALATSSTRAWVETLLEQTGIRDYFEVLRTRDDVANVKPDPELYVTAVEQLEVEPDQALAFEDSLNGLNAAVSAGLHTVVVPNSVTCHLPFEHYSLRLSSMKDMPLREVLAQLVG